jgi:hypothetical protein
MGGRQRVPTDNFEVRQVRVHRALLLRKRLRDEHLSPLRGGANRRAARGQKAPSDYRGLRRPSREFSRVTTPNFRACDIIHGTARRVP